MAKKITLTVNESLFQKIDEWRSSFNLSRLFQDAVAEAIRKKEELQRMLHGKADIPRIAERLKAEKNLSLAKARAAGEEDGTAWAGNAHYEELVCALADLNAGRASAAEDDCLAVWESGRGPDTPQSEVLNPYREAYREGWRSGVTALWELVKVHVEA
jgi:hypothetical protein